MLVTRPLKRGADRVFELDAFPRIGLELLHAERDALRLRIEADDLHLDGLADMQRLGRMIDAPPGDVGDVQQAVDAAQIDEGAVIGDVLDDARRGSGPPCRLATSSERASARLSSSTARRETTILPRERSILRIWNGCGVPSSGRDVAHRADVDLAARQEGDGAVEIDGEAALDAAEDHAGDALIRPGSSSRAAVQASSRRAFSRDSCASPFLSSIRSR